MNCLKCKDPGACCRRFYVIDPAIPWAFTVKENKKTILKKLKDYKLPFIPFEKNKIRWIFRCNKLSDKGRCRIYSSRPDLCKKYKAGTGFLCVHSKEYKPVP